MRGEWWRGDEGCGAYAGWGAREGTSAQGGARRGPPLLCARGAPVHLGFRAALPRGSASVPPRQLAPRAGHVALPLTAYDTSLRLCCLCPIDKTLKNEKK
ncbi:hypothetical protein RR48_14540 [Papilio machaon]|uniref:Uncharacterized protein n=1 Tax=Papilio machaon TaxID=76193 RepID=A0A194QKL2_PAPMA|nr:hypothetical protein RR48_14540 [Papilio machaon]